MKTKLSYPLWGHLPAVLALAFMIFRVVAAGPLPAEAPVHFGFGGAPDGYGSPWLVFGLTIGLGVFFVLLSAFFDELWARQEKTKAFNWLSLFDEVAVGTMAGLSLGYLEFINAGGSLFGVPWGYVLPVVGVCIGLAILLEALRPFRPAPQQVVAEDSRALEAEMAKRMRDNTPFVYWESQNPLYVTLLTTILPLVMFAAAAFTWLSEGIVSIALVAVGVFLITLHGGLRTVVTRKDITVRFGMLGIRVLRLKMAEVVEAGVHEFSPLKDFGGYGIRFNREMRGYFMSGNRGVRITTTGGKKYLIGSDHPERLQATIQAVTGSGG